MNYKKNIKSCKIVCMYIVNYKTAFTALLNVSKMNICNKLTFLLIGFPLF